MVRGMVRGVKGISEDDELKGMEEWTKPVVSVNGEL